MTALLERVIREVESLPKDDQDSFASEWLAELESERRWDKLFTDGEEAISILALEALAELDKGEAIPAEAYCEV